MNNRIEADGGGIGFFGVLGIVFITLKLTGAIAWSWWWVLAPFWVPLSITLLAIAFIVFVTVILKLVSK